jgi:hypothetical protein
MRHPYRLMFAAVAFVFAASIAFAQSGTGNIALSARVTPTGAYPEPVRQFTFYVLTKSYLDIVKEVGSQDVVPSLPDFIEKWSCSPELKKWMKEHNTVDLSSTDLDKDMTTDDIMKIPEFFDAYERSNSGGVTKGLPQPKFREADKKANPERYDKLHQEWLDATRRFIDTNSYTKQGIELELFAVNPKPAWEKLNNEHHRKVAQTAPDTAQLKYLAAKAETDLDGHAVVSGLAPGAYWVSSLGIDAASGDRRLVWDVPAKVVPGQTTRVELSNLNAYDPRSTSASASSTTP